ncbi:MAG: hypothetical protein OHK0046_49220 [Anaerolineae bacterium]
MVYPTPQSPMHYQFDPVNRIHTFTFYASNRQAVDLWLEQMNRIYEDVDPAQPVLFLMDTRISGALPITYGFTKGRQWVRRLDVHPPAYIALVHVVDGSAMSLIMTFLRSLRLGHLTTHWFSSETAYEEAVQWLSQSAASQR